ncbi:MAG: hypothetical protein COX40_00465 [Candidatus Omnitrophica bacterium CG23_combo_of_CG06-09_8_20_14_all_40_11]|nr:MAG: hypothetical protein COX40_00465 [Candidatus Omnitrophica bacterium CG23_combo_of_CG06-09_8_20_14_all_40_11]
MDEKVWQNYAMVFKELLNLEYSPVAVSCIKESPFNPPEKKVRICRAILDAGKGEILQIDKRNNACFGASWHLGFHKISDPKIINMIKKFVVEGEKLFCSYEALDKLMSQIEEVPDNSGSYFILSPLEKAQDSPDVVIFICNAEAACRLLTLATFLDGVMPKIKIGGPTCRMSIIYPLLTGELNLSFYDYTARKMCNVEKDKLLISIPYKKIPQIMESIDKCSAGRAKIEYPAEFRQFLQTRLTTKQGQ